MSVTPTFWLGIDVGGTKIAAGLISLPDGVSKYETVIPTLASQGGSGVLDRVLELAQSIRFLAHRDSIRIAGIGLGLCELVDRSGKILSAANFDWQGLPVKQSLSDLAPTKIDADVRAAAIAEARFGSGKSLRHFLYVTVGTGISAAWVVDGRPTLGSNGLTGTFASSALPCLEDLPAGERSRSLEDYSSGPALLRRFNEKAQRPMTSTAEVSQAAQNGEMIARQVLLSGAEALGAQLAILVGMLDPETVVVGGGLGSGNSLYRQMIADAFRAHVYSDHQRNIPIVPAQLRGAAGWTGAAISAWQSFADSAP